MDMTVSLGREADLDELTQLYDSLNDYLTGGVNWPGWRKGLYPARDTAAEGIADGCLYVARQGGSIIGSVILRHKPEDAYSEVRWAFDSDYSDVLVIYTFAVHPAYLNRGVGRALLDFCVGEGLRTGARSLRLDVFEGNAPAIRLYEKCGFGYVGTVDLGLGQYGLDRFRLYEKLLTK